MKIRLFHACLLAAALPGLMLTTAVQADSPGSVDTLIVTATRIPQNIGSASSSISRIDESVLERVSHVHITETLARVPGIWISRGNGQEHLTAIRSPVLTGPGSCGAFYIAEDGIPVRAPGFCNVNQLFDINTEQAGAIEVIRGPGTAVHGSNALNGIINVLSKAPSPQRSGQVAVEGGPNDYYRTRLSYSDGNERDRIRISANVTHDGGYKDDSGFDQQKVSLRRDYQGETWSTRSLLSLTNLEQDTAGFVVGRNAFKDSRRKRENPNPEAFRDTRSLRMHTRFERPAHNDSVFVVTPYFRYTQMDFLQHFLPGTPLEQNGQRSFGLQSVFFQPPGASGRIHHGFDLDWTHGWLKETQQAPSFGAFPTGKHYDFEVDALNLAWFLGGDWTLGTTAISAGARYERQEYDYTNRMIDGNTAADGSPCAVSPCRFSRPADRTDIFRNWSFHAGLIQPITEQLSFVSHASHGFRAPQANELYRLQGNQTRADLDSEEVNSVELGFRGSTSWLQYELVSFYMRKNDVIIQDSERRNISGGKTRHQGIELLLSWQIIDSLSLAVSGTYARHQFANRLFDVGTGPSVRGNDITTAPRRIANARLLWQPLPGTDLELELIYLDEYFLNTTNTSRYPGHELLNLRWRQQLGDAVHAAVRVTNLTDEDYAERADFAFGNERYFIGEPRSVFVELGLRF